MFREGKFRFSHSTGLLIDVENWDQKEQRVQRKHKNARVLNETIEGFKEDCERIHAEYKADNRYYAFDEFIVHFKTTMKKLKEANAPTKDVKPKLQIIKTFETFLTVKKEVFSVNTLKRYITIRNKIKDFEKFKKVQFTLDDIDSNFYENYYNFCVKQKKNANNTIEKEFKNFYTFLEWCREKEYIHAVVKFNQKISTTETMSEALTKEELRLLLEYDFESERLSKVRDMFCFSCLTGARFSDIDKMTWAEVEGSNWRYTSKKTKTIVIAPINKQAKEILDRYRGIGTKKVFPTISDQKANEYIKEACQIVGLDKECIEQSAEGNRLSQEVVPKYKKIAFHTGRRTFATLSVRSGIPHSVVMKVTGHKSLGSFMKYIRMTVSDVEDAYKEDWALV
jgi:integrase